MEQLSLRIPWFKPIWHNSSILKIRQVSKVLFVLDLTFCTPIKFDKGNKYCEGVRIENYCLHPSTMPTSEFPTKVPTRALIYFLYFNTKITKDIGKNVSTEIS
jgi:hypothetical protein